MKEVCASSTTSECMLGAAIYIYIYIYIVYLYRAWAQYVLIMCRTQTAQSDSTRTARGAPNQSGRTAPLDLKIMDVSVAISPVTPMSQHIPFIPTHFWIRNSRRRDPTTVAARSHLPVRRLRPCQARREGCPQLAFILVLHLPMNHRSSAPRHSPSTTAAFFASSSIRRFTKVHRLRWVYIEFTLHEEFH
jgi:hypothetical protein